MIRLDLQGIVADGSSETPPGLVRNPANHGLSDHPDDSPDDALHPVRAVALALARAALALVDVDAVRVRGLLVDLVDVLETLRSRLTEAVVAGGPRRSR